MHVNLQEVPVKWDQYRILDDTRESELLLFWEKFA